MTAKSLLQDPKAPGWDWFQPAIKTQGTLNQAFDAVRAAIDYKLALLEALQRNLCHRDQRRDLVTMLLEETTKLEATLTFRLGMLSAERPGAWFRPNINQGSGPFASPILTEPVLAPYDSKKTISLRFLLKKSYQEGQLLPLPFYRNEPCLWSTLLRYNQQWHQINRLPEPFANYSFENPNDLPIDLISPDLMTFMNRVAKALSQTRSKLDHCYHQLWQACEVFWNLQQGQNRDQADRGRKDRINSHQHHREEPTNFGLSPVDIRALRLLNFEHLPAFSELKQRYHDLALRWHPDVKGGSEVRFHQLAQSYRYLSQRIKSLTA